MNFVVSNVLTSDSQKIADGFNEYFSSVGANLSSAFVKSRNYLNYLVNCDTEFSILPTNASEISQIVKKLYRCCSWL